MNNTLDGKTVYKKNKNMKTNDNVSNYQSLPNLKFIQKEFRLLIEPIGIQEAENDEKNVLK